MSHVRISSKSYAFLSFPITVDLAVIRRVKNGQWSEWHGIIFALRNYYFTDHVTFKEL